MLKRKQGAILNDKHFTSKTSYFILKYDVLDVKCLSFNIELQHIGMSSIKNREQLRALKINIHTSTLNFYHFTFLTRVQIFLSTDMIYFQS